MPVTHDTGDSVFAVPATSVTSAVGGSSTTATRSGTRSNADYTADDADNHVSSAAIMAGRLVNRYRCSRCGKTRVRAD